MFMGKKHSTIPPKLVIRRLFLPCLSIKDDATAVPERESVGSLYGMMQSETKI